MSSRAALAAFVAVTFLAPLAGAVARPDAWYFALARPGWTPPPWLFGPVWTLLYLMMAVAAWMVWKRPGTTRPLEWWAVQLLLNAAWSPVFFGLHRLGLAVIVIAALWLSIVVTIRAFAAVDRRAAWLLAPYLAWVSYASALNVAIWQMNR